MLKRFSAFLILMCSIAVGAWAQGNTITLPHSGAPTGTCAFMQFTNDTTGGNLYFCDQTNHWKLLASGASWPVTTSVHVQSGGTITIDSGGTLTCAAGSTCSTGTALEIQNIGTDNTSQTLLDFIVSTVNGIGLTVTPSNPSGGQQKFELTGAYTGNAGTATALAAAGTDCGPGYFAYGTDASGNALCNPLPAVTAPTSVPLTQTVSGCGVEYVSGLIYTVAACSYQINGVPYSASEQSVTLPANGTGYAQFDVIFVDITGVDQVLQGAGATNPIVPSVDSSTQLALTSGLEVANGGSAPLYVTKYDMYHTDSNDWATTGTAHVSTTSTNYPYDTTQDIEGTSSVVGNYAQISYYPTATVDLGALNSLVFHIANKAAIPATSSFTAQWYSYNGATYTAKGIPYVVSNGVAGYNRSTIRTGLTISGVSVTGGVATYTYSSCAGPVPATGMSFSILGFTVNPTNNGIFVATGATHTAGTCPTSGTVTASSVTGQVTESHAATGATYQLITIPATSFGLAGVPVNVLRITQSGTAATLTGWYIDDVTLQGGSTSTPLPGTLVNFRGTWNGTTAYSLNDTVVYNGVGYVALAPNTNVAVSTTSTWAELGIPGSITSLPPNVFSVTSGVATFVAQPADTVFASPPSSAPAVVQTSAFVNNTGATDFAIPLTTYQVTAGNSLVVRIVGNSSDITSLTDDHSDSFTLAYNASTNNAWYVATGAVGGFTTITVHATVGALGGIAMETTPLATSSILDASASNLSGVTTSITTTTANDLILAGSETTSVNSGETTAWTVASPFALQSQGYGNFNGTTGSVSEALTFVDGSIVGTYNVAFTYTNIANWQEDRVSVVALKAGASNGLPSFMLRPNNKIANLVSVNGVLVPGAPSMQVPALPGTISYQGGAAQGTSGSPLPLMTKNAADGQVTLHASGNCTAASATSFAFFVSWEDTSTTVQTIAPAVQPNCTTLGPASMAAIDISVNVKASTAITYYTTITSTPAYDLRITAQQNTTQ